MIICEAFCLYFIFFPSSLLNSVIIEKLNSNFHTKITENCDFLQENFYVLRWMALNNI